jgi:hypothetical protein
MMKDGIPMMTLDELRAFMTEKFGASDMDPYTISYTVVGEGFTVVLASSEDDAREKFERGDWESKGDCLEHTITEIEPTA